MKLDSRIILQTDILTCFDNEKAKMFIGQKGYFTDDLYRFDDLRYLDYGTLTDVRDCRNGTFHRGDAYYYQQFFIPESCLKPVEKRYRAYTLAEFCAKFTIGRPINFRKKDNVGNEQYLILNGYKTVKELDRTVHYICIGSTSYILNELFDEYEWQELSTHDWKLFGVEE